MDGQLESTASKWSVPVLLDKTTMLIGQIFAVTVRVSIMLDGFQDNKLHLLATLATEAGEKLTFCLKQEAGKFHL